MTAAKGGSDETRVPDPPNPPSVGMDPPIEMRTDVRQLTEDFTRFKQESSAMLEARRAESESKLAELRAELDKRPIPEKPKAEKPSLFRRLLSLQWPA